MPTATGSGVSGLIQACRGLKGAGREIQDSVGSKAFHREVGVLKPTLQSHGKGSTTMVCRSSGQARRRSCLLVLRDSILSMAINNYHTTMTRHGHHDLETRHQALQAISGTSQTGLQWTVILLSNYPVTAAENLKHGPMSWGIIHNGPPFKYSQECILIGLFHSWLRNDPPIPIFLIF